MLLLFCKQFSIYISGIYNDWKLRNGKFFVKILLKNLYIYTKRNIYYMKIYIIKL